MCASLARFCVIAGEARFLSERGIWVCCDGDGSRRGFFFGKRRGERVQLGVSHIGSRQYRKWEWEVAASMGWKKLAESLF